MKPILIGENTAEGLRGRSRITKRCYEASPMVLRPSRSNSLPLNYSWPNFTVNCRKFSKDGTGIKNSVEKESEPKSVGENEVSSNVVNLKRIIDGNYRQIVEEVNKGGYNIADHYEMRSSGGSSQTSAGSNTNIRSDDLKKGSKQVLDCIGHRPVFLTVYFSKKGFSEVNDTKE